MIAALIYVYACMNLGKVQICTCIYIYWRSFHVSLSMAQLDDTAGKGGWDRLTCLQCHQAVQCRHAVLCLSLRASLNDFAN